MEIIDFSEEYSDYFRILNEEWLKKYFTLEPVDIVNLSNPKEQIIDKGGHIYFVRHDDEIVGTAALIKLSDDIYEFTKMGVTASMQGRGYGKELSLACIKKARELGAKKLILYSSTRLERAITLYKKLGFKEVPLDISDYQRADIKMELQLKV